LPNTKGAKGDGRLQHAFGLLKQNKIEDAIEVLKAVAGSEEARAEEAPRQQRDQKEAAAAFRDLGAIAGLRDPRKALEAYAKAVAFDPDDRESLYWHGRLSLLAGYLPAAEQSLSRLLKSGVARRRSTWNFPPTCGLANSPSSAAI
jgi:tetratricopeptide (TPR) repeat protein